MQQTLIRRPLMVGSEPRSFLQEMELVYFIRRPLMVGSERVSGGIGNMRIH